MSTTTMETKTRVDKSSKKRKAIEPLEAAQKRSSPKASSVAPITPTNLNADGEASEELPKKKRKSLVDQIEVDITKPEPPSRKALRRLKKGKALPPPKSGADTTPEPDDDQPQKSETEKRSGFGIWMGNLPWSATKADVLTFLTTNSSIKSEMITRVHMPSPSDEGKANSSHDSKPWKKQHNKGFAYVDFATAEVVLEAVLLSERLLSGRRVLIKDAKSFEGRPQKTKEEESSNSGKPPNKRIFVGNLRFDTTKESLEEHFEPCGDVDDVMIATFEDSGKCKGYGWVTFKTIEAAEAAVRGWVLVPQEEEEDEEDEELESLESDDKTLESKAEADLMIVKEKSKRRHIKVKKIFIDKIHKRPIRREFAEDAQVRYKKRYGKDGAKVKNSAGARDGDMAVAAGGESWEGVPARAEYPAVQVARMTGTIIQGKGKKDVF